MIKMTATCNTKNMKCVRLCMFGVLTLITFVSYMFVCAVENGFVITYTEHPNGFKPQNVYENALNETIEREHVPLVVDYAFRSGMPHSGMFTRNRFHPNISANLACNDTSYSSSGTFSKLDDLTMNARNGYVTFTITTYDVHKRVRKSGGDVIFVSAKLSGDKTLSVTGQVIDNENGTYTARIKMLWSGKTTISATIVSKYENMCRRMRAMKLYGESTFAMPNPHGIWFRFKHKSGAQTTRCSTSPNIPGYEFVCNLTEANYGVSWFCGSPSKSNLSHDCLGSNYISKTGWYPRLLPPSDIVSTPLVSKMDQKLLVDFKSITESSIRPKFSCTGRQPLDTWMESPPTGVGGNGGWKMTNCVHTQIRTKEGYRRCLSGKTIFIQGDSTVRQYLDHLVERIGLLNEKIVKHRNYLSFFSRSLNFNITWHIHEMPYHCGNSVRVCNADTVAGRLIQNTNGVTGFPDDVIVLLTYNSHIQAHHPNVYRERIRNIVKPLETLIQSKRGAKIFVKGPHPCTSDGKWFDPRIALIYREILVEELAPVIDHVIYLDTFSIAAAYENYELHPTGKPMQAQLDQFLAYIC